MITWQSSYSFGSVKFSMLQVGGRRPRHGPAPKPTTSDSASADLRYACSKMLLVGCRRPRHGHVPKTTMSDSSSTDLQGPCSKMLQVGGRRPLHGPVTNPPCQTLRVVPCEMTCLTHFILERTGSQQAGKGLLWAAQPLGFQRLSSRALPITLTELRAMAPPAITGFRKPIAARGMPATL